MPDSRRARAPEARRAPVGLGARRCGGDRCPDLEGGHLPGWIGLWFAVFPTAEGLLAQAVAAMLVIGSYFLAEHVRVGRPGARVVEQAQGI